MDIDEQVGFAGAHRGALVLFLQPVVGDGILDAVRDETAVSEGLAIDGGVDGKGSGGLHVRAPIDFFELVIERVGIFDFERSDGYENAQGGTQTEIRTIQERFVTTERNSSAFELHLVSSKSYQLLRQNLFETFKSLR